MSKKKKIILGVVLLVILIAIGGILVWLLDNNKDKKIQEDRETIQEGVVEAKIKDEVILEVGTSPIEIKDYFVSTDNLSNNLEIKIDKLILATVYVDKDNNIITEKEYQALDTKKKENYTKKEAFKEVREYDVLIKDLDNNKEYQTKLKIEDKIAPKLSLKSVTIKEGEKYEIQDFVKSCVDNSGVKCNLSFSNEDYKNITKVGTYEIEIIAKDASDNETKEKTELKIEEKKKTTNNTVSKTTNNNGNANSNNNQNKQNTTSNNNNVTNNKPEESKTPEKPKEDAYNKTTNDLKGEATSVKNNNTSIYNEILTSVNNLRNEVGAKPLVLDDSLSLAATIRAMEMAYSKKFSHTRPNGSSCFTVLKELGITYLLAGENIATGQTTATQVMNSWRNSDGHYKNMIGNGFTKIGVGYFKYNGYTYWVQLFI